MSDSDSVRPHAAPGEETNPAFAPLNRGDSSSIVPSRLWAFALGGGLLGALISWAAGEASRELFVPGTHIVQGMGGPMAVSSSAELASSHARNAMLAFSLMGGVLAAGLGLAGGLAHHRLHDGLRAAAIGLLLGSVAGAGITRLVLPPYFRAVDRYEDKVSLNMAIPLLMHGAIWGVIGAVSGLAFGVGCGGGAIRLSLGLIGGLIGGCLGAVFYEIVGGMAFPLDETVQPLSLTWGSRLLARAAVCIAAAAGTAFAIVDVIKRKQPMQAP